jgi:NAD-dependent dihydropyrimidine dehydrogenase PreA subunit
MRMTYLKNGETLSLNGELCNGCRECIEVCPHAVFELRNGKAVIADREACMECGACALNCASGALMVKAGVGCAAAVIQGIIRGTAPSCGCGGATAAEGSTPKSQGTTCCG